MPFDCGADPQVRAGPPVPLCAVSTEPHSANGGVGRGPGGPPHQGGIGRFMRYGYFDNENREYVITRVDVPVSWTNYLGVKNLCTVISHNAGGYSFHGSPEHHR